MAYFPPVITAAGLSVPVFVDIQNALINSYRTNYGSTTYLGNDSADYQWITAVSLKLNDNMGLCQLAYNARSPLTAVGADLDSIAKLNGLARLSSSSSTVVLLLSGISGTVIDNAVVSDVNGILWQLPLGVTIGIGGSVSSVAVCQQGGAVTAAINTITTPVGGFTAGWTAVTNPAPAIVGTPTESDSNFRARQSISVALPSSTRLAGTVAELKQVPGVTLINVLENQTSVTDSFGNEGHSLTCVVQGGTDLAVATAIFDNRGIGPNTQGATATAMTLVPVVDPNSGATTTIGFIRPTSVQIYVKLSVHGLNAGFTTATQAAIIAAIVLYLNSLQIGEAVTASSVNAAAMSVTPSIFTPLFSIQSLLIGTAPNPTTAADINLLFYQLSLGITANVSLTVV